MTLSDPCVAQTPQGKAGLPWGSCLSGLLQGISMTSVFILESSQYKDISRPQPPLAINQDSVEQASGGLAPPPPE